MELAHSRGRWFGITGYALAALGVTIALLMVAAISFFWWMVNHGGLGPDWRHRHFRGSIRNTGPIVGPVA
jgi:hypothetical protein